MVGRNVNKTKKEELGPGAPYTQAEKDICTAADLEAGDVCGAGESGAEGAALASPASLAIDSSGQVWVGDSDRIASFGPDGSAGPEVALPGAGQRRPRSPWTPKGTSSPRDRRRSSASKSTFEGFADGDTFTLGNLPAHCSEASTGSDRLWRQLH